MKAYALLRHHQINTARGPATVRASTPVTEKSQRLLFDDGAIMIVPADRVYPIAPDDFTRAYLDCALWSSTDDGGDPFSDNYGLDDISPDTLACMLYDCARFQRENAADIVGRERSAGHDFWLTRNGHGAGFWDGDWPEAAGERLTAASDALKECDLYVGDDGLVYAC